MASQSTQFLKDQVYPNLDAVQSGLLDGLQPVKSKGRGNKAHILDCPSCSAHHRAFIYPGSGYIKCNRTNECGSVTSVWDYLEQTGLDAKDVFTTLCEAAKVTPPKLESNLKDPSVIAKNALQEIARRHDDVIEAFCALRKLTKDQFFELGYGYFSNKDEMAQLLTSGPMEVNSPEYAVLTDQYLEKRICSLWPQESGKIALWGRAFDEDLEALVFNKKYRFSPGLSKRIPYGWSNKGKGTIVGCEGTFDADSLRLAGFNACAFGQSFINHTQALFLMTEGVTEVIFVVDGDKSGKEGILKTIENLEPLGINTRFVVLADGEDDPDMMRRNGKSDELKERVQNAAYSGSVLASMIANASHMGANFQSAIPRLLRLRAFLTPTSLAAFEAKMEPYGSLPHAHISEALKIAAVLIESGLTPDEAFLKIKERHKLKIEIYSEVNS